jgi:hypothetical protein
MFSSYYFISKRSLMRRINSEVIAKLHSKANIREAMHIVSAMQHLSMAYGYALNMQGDVEGD